MVKKCIFFLLCFLALPAYSDNSEKHGKAIYSTKVFNGNHFSEMTPVSSHSIYLFADKPNFIQLSLSTEDSDTSITENFSQFFLEIYKGDTPIKQITNENILIYNQTEKKPNNWKVFRGIEADIESAIINGIQKRYNESYKKYLKEYENITKLKKEILKKIKQFSLAGISTAKLSMDFQALKVPEEPSKLFIEGISRFQAYYVNLPEGEYQIMIKQNKKIIYEESRRKLFFISPRRKNIIGYQIIPGNIWSPPVYLNSMNQIFYTNGKSNLYITPYFQDEYNDYYFSQIMTANQDGRIDQFRLTKTNEILNMQAEIISSRQTQVVYEQLFDLETNTKFSTGGYPYHFIKKSKEENTRLLRAFYLPMNEAPSYIKIRLQNSEGTYLQSSTREIRVVDPTHFPLILYFITFIPLIMMLILIIKKKSARS